MPTDHPSPTTEPNRPGSDNTFFDWMRGLGIPRQPGWLGGVCAGIAARLGIDPIIVRGIVVVIAVLGGPALLLYAAAWLLVPDSFDRIHLQEAVGGNFDKAHAGIGAMFLLSFLPIAQGLTWQVAPWWGTENYFWYSWPSSAWGLFWTVCILGSIVWFVIWLVNRSKATPATSSTQATNDAAPAGTSSDDTTTGTPTQSDAASSTTSLSASPPAPEAPPRPDSGATDDDLAAWKEQQAAWKREYDGWKQQQASGERELAQQRAAEQRRVKQEQSAQRHRAAGEEQRRTRSNPVYSLVAIGLAVIAGAATALVIGETGDATAAITGMAVSLGVLGLAIIVNGFRGKRSGGSSGVAFLLVIALSATSFFGWANGPLNGEGIQWSPTFSASDHDSRRTIVAGNITLDLSDYFTEPPAAGDVQYGVVDLYVGKGDVRVILPAEEFSKVEAHTLAGSIEVSDVRTTFGPAIQAYESFSPRSSQTSQRREIVVTVWVATGDVTITQARK